jgi:hypothetical protein
MMGYRIARVTAFVVAIEDNDDGRSVTNDVERVVSKLFRDGYLRKQPLVYRDTMGLWDEILHDGHGHFTGFRFIGAQTMEPAIEAVTQRRLSA